MAATVETRYYYGAGPSTATVTNLRFKTADDNTQDANNPCVKPAAGTNYSAWKQISLYCTGTAPDNDIDNIKIYTDDVTPPWTGIMVYVGDEDVAIASYDQATGSGDSWDEMTNHAVITAKTDFFTYGSGDPRAVAEAAAWSTPGTNEEITKIIVLQMDIGTGASGGLLSPSETITWQYDET